MDFPRLVKKLFRFEKKIGWSEIIAIGAVIISGFALLLSYWAWQDSRAISGLDLKPEIKIDARLNKAKHKNLHVVVFNSGPVVAFQLEIHFIHHRYFKKLNTIMISGGGTETRYSIPRLVPFKQETFAVKDHFLYGQAMLQNPPEHNILEIRLVYRRAPDMSQFAESAFYFVSPDGLWVGEHSSALVPDIYDPLKQAAFEMLRRSKIEDLHWDTIHPAGIEEN
jgi:hypothetical protein